ncbi:MAG: enoyl-CoA hydratase [Proteobacteria bacterium]|nr:enoyl-CoA hydratase [Pseudomonadota bacterium]
MDIQAYEHLEVRVEEAVVFAAFNRPKVRNALNLKMVEELENLLEALEAEEGVRCLVLKGNGGHFCAGGDVKDMATARSQPFKEDVLLTDPIARLNRRFGDVITKLRQAPQTVVVVVQGAAMGGGFGLVCAADFVLADKSASFRLPETTLGLPPAQIAPFLVERIGLIAAKKCALTGARLSGDDALSMGLVDQLCEDQKDLDEALSALLISILKCAPLASRNTKKLLLAIADGVQERSDILDSGALMFAEATRSHEGMEGIMAYIQKRAPSWSKNN